MTISIDGRIKTIAIDGRIKPKEAKDHVSLERINFTKFLGVIIVENLKWKNHIDAILKLFHEILRCKAKWNIMCLDIFYILYIVL